MHHRVELAPFEPAQQIAGRNEFGELPCREIAPLLPGAENIVDAMSVRPTSFRLATTFEPMKPAPPVTNNIDTASPLEFDPISVHLP